MDQIYLLVNSPEIRLSQNFVQHCDNLLTPVFVNGNDPTNRLTKDLINHQKRLQKMHELTEITFPRTFFAEKYLNPRRLWSSEEIWKQWKQMIGHNNTHYLNPYDRRSLSTHDIPLTYAYISILHHALRNHYKNILILDLVHSPTIPDLWDVMNRYETTIKNCEICFFSYKEQNYGYLLRQSLLESMFMDLSNFIYSLEDLLDGYITMTKKSYQRFNHNEDDCCHDLETFVLSDFLQVSEEIIIILRNELYQHHKQNFYQKEMLSKNDQDLVQCLLDQHPYELRIQEWNDCLSLNFDHYLLLCWTILNHSYASSSHFAIRQPSSNICEINAIYFNHQFYLDLYPCYREHLKTFQETYSHFMNHGIKEKLLPNHAIFTLIQIAQSLLLQRQLMNLPPTPNILSEPSLIYVLTRTCCREQLFKSCVNSLLSQNYPNLRHLVSYDNSKTLEYVKDYPHIYKVLDLTSHKARKIHPNQYIDCLYDVVLSSDPGWVMVLDDDDCFETNRALIYLKQFLNDPTSIVIWQLYRSDKMIYPNDKNNPVVGEIGSCCYMYHSSMIQKGFWKPGGVGDFPFFQQLFRKAQKHIYIDYPLTGVNYINQVSGWTAL